MEDRVHNGCGCSASLMDLNYGNGSDSTAERLAQDMKLIPMSVGKPLILLQIPDFATTMI